jgi:hypothetical protein
MFYFIVKVHRLIFGVFHDSYSTNRKRTTSFCDNTKIKRMDGNRQKGKISKGKNVENKNIENRKYTNIESQKQ